MSFRDEVIELLTNIVVDLLGVDGSELNENTRFKEDLGCASVNIVQITSELENEYDVEVPYMAFNRCKTFGEAADYMSELTGII